MRAMFWSLRLSGPLVGPLLGGGRGASLNFLVGKRLTLDSSWQETLARQRVHSPVHLLVRFGQPPASSTSSAVSYAEVVACFAALAAFLRSFRLVVLEKVCLRFCGPLALLTPPKAPSLCPATFRRTRSEAMAPRQQQRGSSDQAGT